MNINWHKSLLWACAVLILAAAGLAAAVALVLPAYLESRLIPNLAHGVGLSPGQIHVRHIGWWGADLGPLEFKTHGEPVVTLAAVQIDYSPFSLLSRRIDGITLVGLTLKVSVSPQGVTLAGLKPPAKGSAGNDTALNLKALLPVTLDRLAVVNSCVVVDWRGERYEIPFGLRMQTAELDRGRLSGRTDFSILGNPVTLQASLDQDANRVQVSLDADRLLLESLYRIGQWPQDIQAHGTLGFNCSGTFQLSPPGMTRLALSGRLSNTRLAAAGVVLQGKTPSRNEAPQPIDISISARDPSRITWSVGPMQLTGPLQADIIALKGDWAPQTSGWSSNAQVRTLVSAQALGNGLILPKELPVDWQFDLVRTEGRELRFKVVSASTDPLTLAMAPLKLSVDHFQADIHGRRDDAGLTADAALAFGRLRAVLPDGDIEAPGLTITGSAAAEGPSPEAGSKISARAVLSDVRARLGQAAGTLTEIQFETDGRSTSGRPWTFNGHLKAVGGHLRDKLHGVTAEGFALDLPVEWPPSSKAPAGRLILESARWKGRKLGGVQGTLVQMGQSLAVDLEHHSKLFSGLSVLIHGILNSQGVQADIRIPPYEPSEPVSLASVIPSAGGMAAAGRIEGNGTVAVINGRPAGRAYLKIDDGSLVDEASGLNLDGIGVELQLDDLFAVKSAPRQKLRVKNMQFGQLAARDLDVDFQLENSRTLFVEKLGLNWCRGIINTAAIRITAGKEDYDVTFFCDRLNLAMVLEQLGAAKAGGDGTVNGRIPVRWSNGRLSFDNGFLYSTPGQPGLIQLSGTEGLVSGLPPGTPQQVQLDIATEALKDYTYQWAKMSIQSENDMLHLKLQLDGKPNRLLPFAYDKQLGQFIRITGKGQAEFKGINIDLNFNSPLNEILHYKELLNRN